MADTPKTILSVVATYSSNLPNLTIKNGQLIFVPDAQKVALDFNDKRVFYNQIVILQTDTSRTSILAPVNGLFYFVIENAVLWMYQDQWIQITRPPEEIVFIGVELPELGSSKTVYIDKAQKKISVWDNDLKSYIVVSDKTEEITQEDILNLFI